MSKVVSHLLMTNALFYATRFTDMCCVLMWVTLLEVQFLESEVSLHYTSGLDSGSQHILLCGDVICFGYPLQVIQVTRQREKHCFSSIQLL